jgi:hypothetical protein
VSLAGPLVPNLLIAGVTHAGAAQLAAELGRHSQVCLPDVKRIDHFTPLRFGRDVQAGLADYDHHFAGWSDQRYRLETSPVYFDGGPRLISTVLSTLPGLRALIVLRDPAVRLWTGYTDKLARGRLPRAMTFETFVDRCLALRSNGADRFEGNRHFRTLSGGFYLEHLPGWLDAFGRRARVLFTEDVSDDPSAQLTALFDWLSLNPATVTPAGRDREERSGVESGLPIRPSGPSFNRRLWPVLQRTAGPWRHPEQQGTSVPPRMPRQSDRIRHRVRSLYAAANHELAALLRRRGYTELPPWLAQA